MADRKRRIESVDNLYIATTPEDQKTEEVALVRTSGHLADQRIASLKPIEPELWDSLQEDTKLDIGEERLTLGLDLEPIEDDLVDALCELLQDKSKEIKDIKSPSYYLGNVAPYYIGGIIEDGKHSSEKLQTPRFTTTLTEIAKKIKGSSRIGGKEVTNVEKAILGLANKKFLIRYERKTNRKTKTGESVVQFVEAYTHIITLGAIGEKTESGKILKKELTITLHPIFADQIGTKYILRPKGTNKRIKEALGSDKLPKYITSFKNYLLNAMGTGKDKAPFFEINEIKLLDRLAAKDLAEGRKKRAIAKMRKAIDTFKKLGVIIKEERVANSKGGYKYIFYLNRDWYKKTKSIPEDVN